MLRILHINDKTENSGGVETYIEQQLVFGNDYGIDPIWIGVYNNGIRYSLKDSNGKKINENIDFQTLVSTLENVVQGQKIDVIHIHSISNPNLIKALSAMGPLVRSMHEPRMICPGQGKFWSNSEEICDVQFGIHCLLYAYKQSCCNRHPKRLFKAYRNTKFETQTAKNLYSAIIVMSNYMREEAQKNGFTSKSLFLNPYMTPLVPDAEIKLREDGTKRILYVGRLAKTKGVHYLIRSFTELTEKYSNITLDIVGDGHYRDQLVSIVPSHLHSKIIFHGWQNRAQIFDFYRKSYLVVFPSIYPEAFGISGIEAMMHGKPVVGFDVGGVSTWLKHGETGLLCHAKDGKALKNSIDRLLTDESLYLKFSKEARLQAKRKFSPDIHMSKLVNIYNEIIEMNESISLN